MMALLSSLLGFGSSMFPELLGFFKDKSDKAHELNMIKAQAEVQLQLGTQRLEMLEAEAETRFLQSAMTATTVSSGVKWVDAYRGSVRPTVTYLFMLMFVGVEFTVVLSAMHGGLSMLDAIPLIWNDYTQGIFGVVIGFWFGSRHLQKRSIGK